MKTYQRDVPVKVPPMVFAHCASIEANRFGESRAAGMKHTRGMGQGAWLTQHLQALGATVAEWAVCELTGAYWSGLREMGARDTTAGEVKWSRSMDYGLLLPEKGIDRDENYWLVIGEPPDIRVVGMLKGMDVYAAGHELTKNGRPPAWVVRANNVLGWEKR